MAEYLEEQFQYYLDHQKELVEKYNGKVIVIHNCEVVGSYESELEAVEASKGTLPLGEFLVQKVSPGEAAYIQTFHSRVVFG